MSTRQVIELKTAIEMHLKDFGSDFVIEYFEPAVIKQNDSYLSCYFASLVEGANIEAHEQIVLNSNDPIESYYFASSVKGANIEAHEKVVLSGESYIACYDFAKSVEGADVEAHFNRMKQLAYTVDDSDPEELKIYEAILGMVAWMVHQNSDKPNSLKLTK